MDARDREPESGGMIIHVISDAWGPFVDIRASYESLARRRPWTHVIAPRELEAVMKSPLWQDERVLIVLWELADPGPGYLRRCKVVHIYAEAMDEDSNALLPQHLAHWQRFKDMIPHFDAVFSHTPWAADFIARHAQVRSFAMPVGWDAAAMGAPRWHAPKHQAIGYHGSSCGRREVYVPFFKSRLGNHWRDMTGQFGRGLIGQLDTTTLSLYIAHSPVMSFSTWRLWQCASTSCALVVEGACDTWPATDECYLQLPRIEVANAAWVSEELCRFARADDLCLRAANALHELAQKFTLDYVEDTYVLPALQRMIS